MRASGSGSPGDIPDTLESGRRDEQTAMSNVRCSNCTSKWVVAGQPGDRSDALESGTRDELTAISNVRCSNEQVGGSSTAR